MGTINTYAFLTRAAALQMGYAQDGAKMERESYFVGKYSGSRQSHLSKT